MMHIYYAGHDVEILVAPAITSEISGQLTSCNSCGFSPGHSSLRVVSRR